MAKKRDYYRYELRDGHRIVYIGITDDPTRRKDEHKSEGKRFSNMNIVGPTVTVNSAEQWEEERLKSIEGATEVRIRSTTRQKVKEVTVKMYFRILFVVFIATLFLTSCATWQMRQQRNRDNLMRLDLGMTKEQVIQIMGKPDLNEAYQKADGGKLVILFYYTNRKWADGNVTKDECTPLVFENGKLIGWGDEFYQSKIKVELEIKNK